MQGPPLQRRKRWPFAPEANEKEFEALGGDRFTAHGGPLSRLDAGYTTPDVAPVRRLAALVRRDFFRVSHLIQNMLPSVHTFPS